ncbi:4-hydroxy-tetrahydrodipicolinate reductase [Carnobacteriaceae bacterium zg-C25]|nr:4-hydroxy-tetrahydrodipicolinate reductase [Carnobacteriaceae bacterium zg-C25]
MNIILSGYGAMGKVVDELARENGHTVVGIFSTIPIDNCPYPVVDKVNDLPKADVIIDFSHPINVTPLLEQAHVHLTPIVVATTGAREHLQQLMADASQHISVFFSANMSYGVHVFTQLLKYAAPLLQGYDIEIIERHHNQKVDAPSGTAIKLLEALQSVNPALTPVYDRSQLHTKRSNNEVGMSVVRGGTIVGEHEVLFAGVDEVFELTHRAQSKRIFADGALRAASKLIEKNSGFYDFTTL